MIWGNTNKRKVQIQIKFKKHRICSSWLFFFFEPPFSLGGKTEKRPLLLGLIYHAGAHTVQHVFLWVCLATTRSSRVGRCRSPQTQVDAQSCQLGKSVTRSGDLNCPKQKVTNLLTFFGGAVLDNVGADTSSFYRQSESTSPVHVLIEQPRSLLSLGTLWRACVRCSGTNTTNRASQPFD